MDHKIKQWKKEIRDALWSNIPTWSSGMMTAFMECLPGYTCEWHLECKDKIYKPASVTVQNKQELHLSFDSSIPLNQELSIYRLLYDDNTPSDTVSPVLQWRLPPSHFNLLSELRPHLKNIHFSWGKDHHALFIFDTDPNETETNILHCKEIILDLPKDGWAL
jgi:hypothetical protein